MKKIITLLFLLSPFSALADGLWVQHTLEEEFEIVKEYILEGITNQGLVVAHTSNVGSMLERTGKDLGDGQTSPFSRSEVIEFCSAKLSRKVTLADPAAVIFCPYSIALYSTAEQPDIVHLTYLKLSKIGSEQARPALQEVEAMLAQIISEVLE